MRVQFLRLRFALVFAFRGLRLVFALVFALAFACAVRQTPHDRVKQQHTEKTTKEIKTNGDTARDEYSVREPRAPTRSVDADRCARGAETLERGELDASHPSRTLEPRLQPTTIHRHT